MYGINGKPFIDLDKHLPIDEFNSLHHDIMYGIAMSYTVPGTYGDNNLLDQSNRDFGDDSIVHKNKLFKSTIDTIYGVDQMDTLGRRRTFIKGLYGLVSLGPIVYLKYPPKYTETQNAEIASSSSNIIHFPTLMAYVDRLPFVSYGRVLLFLSEHNQSALIHSDINARERDGPFRKDFIWISSSADKNFFIYDELTDTKHLVECQSAFFNVKDYHGSLPASKYLYSLRVDGWFTDEFRERIGIGGMTAY